MQHKIEQYLNDTITIKIIKNGKPYGFEVSRLEILDSMSVILDIDDDIIHCKKNGCFMCPCCIKDYMVTRHNSNLPASWTFKDSSSSDDESQQARDHFNENEQ